MVSINSVFSSMKKLPRKMFGTRNDRLLKRMQSTVEQAAVFEDELRTLCSEGDDYDAAFAKRRGAISAPGDAKDADAQAAYERQLQDLRVELSAPLRERADDLGQRLQQGEEESALMPEAFAILREASRRAKAHRHFDCQLIGGQTLAEGKVAEMRTGEGKTIVCHLAIFLKVSQAMKAHVVTVNDYLVKRDAEFAQPIFELLGYSVGYIQSQVDPGGREGIRRQMYECDITYGTASEFGFDYLRDNMKVTLQDQVQGSLDFVIIDEVDSILIDEARTPLIISGPAHDDVTRYPRANKVAEELVRRQNQWDRKVLKTVAAYDGNSRNIPKLDDAMSILGHRETPGRGKKKGDAPEPEDDGESGSDESEDGALPTLGPDFLIDDHIDAIQAYEYEVLKKPAADLYRRFFITQIDRKQVGITHEGVTIAQEVLNIGSLYSGANMTWPHLIENALRAHKVYQVDRDYVVKDGAIIIVDPFTGRLMHGRQWSDGLHQAVEAREHVQVKEETQTLATITIQNFFKLYKQMAGMTGTALTEANEFMKIYGLDVLEIPTNRPINRQDHNDKMYRDVEQKYGAIVDEIHEVHRNGRPADPFMLFDLFKQLKPILQSQGADVSRMDEAMRHYNAANEFDPKVVRFMCEVYDEVMGDLAVGRPVLVGTTSVENSEKISRMLDRRYGIEHEVLNAKNHAREAEIVMKAGQQVEVARGKSKDLRGNVTIATNMAGRGTDIKLSHMVVYPTCKVPEQLPDGAEESGLYPTGITKCCISCAEYDPATNCAHCFKPKIDPRFPELGRKVCPINVPCGLHIIGTERHEARRIDNQLRGRAGRQGDPGSSRFFLSLQDDLLKLFMPDWMLRMMEKLGFTDGTSLEDKRLSRGIRKAQSKVEERNFATRKNLLEWDEPMDYQRKEFYKSRQRILEERGLQDVILHTIRDSIDDMLQHFLGGGYAVRCISEWCRSTLDVAVAEDRIDTTDLEALQNSIRKTAKDEAYEQIRTTIGEYIDPEESPRNWDVGGLLTWAQRQFPVKLTQNQMRKMEPDDIENTLLEASQTHYDTVKLDGLEHYLEPNFPHQSFAEWALSKFNIRIELDDILGKSLVEVKELLHEKVQEAYAEREINYPVEFCMERCFGADVPAAVSAEMVTKWVNSKYQADWTLGDVEGKSPRDLYDELTAMNRAWLTNGKLKSQYESAIGGQDDEAKIEWMKERVGRAWSEAQFEEARQDEDVSLDDALLDQGRRMLRYELSRLEQYILLRIYDQVWKDHLLEMDHLRSAIQQRPLGGDQTHPQSQFAIEGNELFHQMWGRIAERVTDIVFKVKVGADDMSQAAVPSLGTSGDGNMQLQHGDASNAAFTSASRDTEAAMRAQNVEQGKAETIRRDQPKVGRNDPCPCGSGKKFKQCHGKRG